MLRDDDGRIWVATAGGAAVVDPRSLHAYKRTLPPVVIEQVLANDTKVPLQSARKLPAGTRKLEFHYASLSFQTPRFVRYRYRLEGVDATGSNAATSAWRSTPISGRAGTGSR